jgi:hypothetical protein
MKKHPADVTAVNQVCLYYNRNSHMAAKEAKEWSFFGPRKECSVDQTAGDAVILDQLKDDFASLPRRTKAVIISSDPFLASRANAVKTAAQDKFGGPVCYPNALYHSGSTQANVMIYGASLLTAYSDLGRKAVDLLALAKPKNMGLDTPIPEILDGPSPSPFAKLAN